MAFVESSLENWLAQGMAHPGNLKSKLHRVDGMTAADRKTFRCRLDWIILFLDFRLINTQKCLISPKNDSHRLKNTLVMI